MVCFASVRKAGSMQVKLYQAVLKSKPVRSLLRAEGEGIEALPAITMLRKLCNHPCLLESTADLPEECLLDLRKVKGSSDGTELSGKSCSPKLYEAQCPCTCASNSCQFVTPRSCLCGYTQICLTELQLLADMP